MIFPHRGWWQRLRHGRGFGVHSPFAYRFIREVLRERCAYYSYDYVDSIAAGWPGGKVAARMLFRVAVFTHPRHVAVGSSELSPVASGIIASACPGAVVSAGIRPDTDLVVMFDDAGVVDAAFSRAADGATIVIPDSHISVAAALLERLKTMLPYGQCFVNGSSTVVFVGRRSIPAETFSVRF